jgi:tetratricopeptide (TPR) repeat protein
MIENAKAIGLSQDVIDALENAKTKLLAAKSVNEILSIAEEIKVEKDEFTEQKRKNFERAIEHLESRLHEAKLNAQQFGISDDVFDEIQELVDDAKEQWAAGETKSAMNMLEKAEKSLRQVSGTMERAKKLFGELDRLANAAEELREKAAGNQEALDAIDKAVALISDAKGTLMTAVSQDDLENVYGMSEQAKQLLERVRHMIGSKITRTPGTVDDSNALKRRIQALADKAERLKEIAEKQQNREAMGIIMESIDIINKAKQMISEEDYEHAKSLLNQADELLTKAERILRSGRDAGSKTNAPVNETQAIAQEIEMLEAVVADLKSKAGDNKEADEHINAAIEDLNDAKELVEQGHLDKAKSKVNDAKEHLRTAKQFIDGKSSEEKESGNDRSG